PLARAGRAPHVVNLPRPFAFDGLVLWSLSIGRRMPRCAAHIPALPHVHFSDAFPQAAARAPCPPQCLVSGIGYSSALSTQPGFIEKSTRGGEKMSISWFSSEVATEVWITGGGMTVIEGEPTTACTSSRQCF